MPAKVLSATVVGLDGEIVEVEADTNRGLPKMAVVGLPDAAVQEARERVSSGIKNSGISLPPISITVNLAPADLKKAGTAFDLPIALSILLARGVIKSRKIIDNSIFLGELSLNGEVRPVSGVLPAVLTAKSKGIANVFVSRHNVKEASAVKGVNVYPVGNLKELIMYFRGQEIKAAETGAIAGSRTIFSGPDMSEIKGQEQAKRALEIAAAGSHNILFTGAPGSGKTMLARAMPGILPPMSFEESLEVTKIYSVAGLLKPGSSLVGERPFRSPHHTSSAASLVGGGSVPRPGEITLAHLGVLFLDELPEFPKAVLESLRQPLEDGIVTVARVSSSVIFPARFTLIAARNPCPCGYFNDEEKKCLCSPQQVIRYQKKISGPLLDRIDMHVSVPRLSYQKIKEPGSSEPSASIRQRIIRARKYQRKRFFKSPLDTNSGMNVRQINKYCQTGKQAENLLKEAVNKFYLSVRTYHRILKVARTIADLKGEELISTEHIAEALQFRP